jgi:hypothetical protein
MKWLRRAYRKWRLRRKLRRMAKQDPFIYD